jgi:integrase/recombinase XerD
MTHERSAVFPHSELAVSGDDLDDGIIALWLHGRPATTKRAYSGDIRALRACVRKPISNITLDDLQCFSDSLAGSVATQARILSSVKSLFSFAVRIGYLPWNVGGALRLPPRRRNLAERLLSEEEIAKIISAARGGRDNIMLRLMYATGARVSEICAMRWRNLQAVGDGGVIAIFGKGGQERVVRLTPSCWRDLVCLRHGASPDDRVFRTGSGRMDVSTVWRIVRAATIKAGLTNRPSPHWFRHAAASHALMRGAPLTLVRDTLGHSSIAITSVYLHTRPTESLGQFLDV